MNEPNNLQLFRIDDVSKLTTLGKTTINLWVAQGKFPKPTTLSQTIKVWRYSDIQGWIDGFEKEDESNICDVSH